MNNPKLIDYHVDTPTQGEAGHFINFSQITLRDLFAAVAMQGQCANPALWASVDELGDKGPKEMAEISYNIAEAMLAERDVRNAGGSAGQVEPGGVNPPAASEGGN